MNFTKRVKVTNLSCSIVHTNFTTMGQETLLNTINKVHVIHTECYLNRLYKYKHWVIVQ